MIFRMATALALLVNNIPEQLWARLAHCAPLRALWGALGCGHVRLGLDVAGHQLIGWSFCPVNAHVSVSSLRFGQKG